jgi:hypothetical protein
MGELLEFKPRVPKPAEPQDFTKLYKRTLDHVRGLVDYYKSTIEWGSVEQACDPHIVRAIAELKTVCTVIAGANNEQPTQSIG